MEGGGGGAQSLHDLTAEDNQGNTFSFAQLKGKVVLIVNVASKCGFTPQYKALQALYDKYKDQGLVVIGFPCNQFGGQEPAPDAEIHEFCQRNFGVNFPLMKKIEVNGDHTHPVYAFLKSSKSGIFGLTRIKWNFEKFLVDKKGQVSQRYSSITTPASMEKDIEKLLNQEE
ncbi:Glutathione peroxidase 2 [Balamuthia mandrillaris]